MNRNFKSLRVFPNTTSVKSQGPRRRIFGMAFLLLICMATFSQQSNGMLCRKSNKIYLVGSEPYENTTTFPINIDILRRLNFGGIYPKYFLLEGGHGTAFILNRYLENGDESILNGLFPFDAVSSKYFEELRALNQSLLDNQKFSFKGVSYDHNDEATHLALRYLLLSPKEFSDNTMCTANLSYVQSEKRFDYLVCSFIDQRLTAQRTKEDIELMMYLLNSSDSTKVIKKMGDKYSEAKLVLKGYLLGKERKRGGVLYSIPGDEGFRPKREKLIEENIYQLFLQDTTKYIFGSFMSYSKLFMDNVKSKDFDGFNTFANTLNNDVKYPLTNNRICASVILYKKDLKQQSKDYGLDKDELLKKYKTLEPNKLYIEQYMGKYPMINQMLFYNHKPIKK